MRDNNRTKIINEYNVLIFDATIASKNQLSRKRFRQRCDKFNEDEWRPPSGRARRRQNIACACTCQIWREHVWCADQACTARHVARRDVSPTAVAGTDACTAPVRETLPPTKRSGLNLFVQTSRGIIDVGCHVGRPLLGDVFVLFHR
jgi:hypothetical protein